ncbi:PAS domain-containing sensor histidine kinase [uncultured Clostridium sp.]|uniref:sensor histidine kinase n=1 Tax=uncultured Clostridium sp. TaxID=59620 RepID=UPI002629FE02|nr:PAS domain-containing sensor histidine kinase [uncultured Clostridium sp.]
MSFLALIVISIYNKVFKNDQLWYIGIYFIALIIEIIILITIGINVDEYANIIFLRGSFFRWGILVVFLFRKSKFIKYLTSLRYRFIWLKIIICAITIFIAVKNNSYNFISIERARINVFVPIIGFCVFVIGLLYNCKKNFEEDDTKGFFITIMILFIVKGLAHKFSNIIFKNRKYNIGDLVDGELSLLMAILIFLFSMAVVLLDIYEKAKVANEEYKLFYNIVDKNDNSNIFIYTNGDLVYANGRAKKIWLGNEDYSGDLENLNKLISAGNKNEEIEKLKRYIENKEQVSLIIKDNKEKRYSVMYQSVGEVDRKKKYKQYDVFMVRDIIDKITLDNEGNKFCAINNSIDEIVFVLDENFQITYVNKQCQKEIGLKEDVIIGNYISKFASYEISNKKKRILGAIINNENKIIEVEVKVKKLMDDYDTLIGYAVICFKVEDEEKIKKLSNRVIDAEKIVYERDSFTNLAHDLRTPIHIIYSSLQLLKVQKENIDSEKFKVSFEKYEKTIVGNAQRLLNIVDEIADSNSEEEFKKGYYNIVSVVKEVSESMMPYMKIKEITFEFTTSKEEFYIECDKSMVERIILNLVSNAIKFTPINGYIYIEIFFVNSWVEILVKDTGIGIDREFGKVVFERFKQCGNIIDAKNGSGIGLYSVKRLVELHEGTIDLESDIGEGCIFTVKLPVNK